MQRVIDISQVMLQSNGKYLAFSTDSGAVGIIELSTKKISRMKTRHNTVCFLPMTSHSRIDVSLTSQSLA